MMKKRYVRRSITAKFVDCVQDRNVRVDLEPMFVLTYYEKVDPVKKLVYYDKMVEAYNSRLVLERKLRITNEEAALTEDQVAVHFASIDNFSARIVKNPNDVDAYFGRALDFMLVQDFTEAVKDYTKVTNWIRILLWLILTGLSSGINSLTIICRRLPARKTIFLL